MKRTPRIWGWMLGSLLALGSLAASPAEAQLGWIGFKNETQSPVVVQISHLAKGRIQHGKAHLLVQGNVAWERMLQQGDKLITVYDAAQPRRVLFQQKFPFVGQELFYAIELESAPPPVPVPALAAKVKLTAAKPPAPPGQVPPGP